MNIYIKNMVCVRCKMAVQSVLEDLDIDYLTIEMGRVNLAHELNDEQLHKLNWALKRFELELMEDKKKILVERIKILIIEKLYSPDHDSRLKFSEYLSQKLGYDYTYLANLFSEMEGITIERFYIFNRIARVKELIVYESLSVTEIAHLLNYSSLAHLCLQFKKVTGETPTMFRKLRWSEQHIRKDA